MSGGRDRRPTGAAPAAPERLPAPPSLAPSRAAGAAGSGAAIQSPCVRRCALHPVARLCVGCGRTGDEIAAWAALAPDARARIMAALPARLARLGQPGSRG